MNNRWFNYCAKVLSTLDKQLGLSIVGMDKNMAS